MSNPTTQIFSLVPAADMRETVLTANAGNKDIIQGIKELAAEATADVVKLAPKFKRDTAENTAFAIWYFLRSKARYVRDSSDRQQIRLPRRFLSDTLYKKNSGDCKSFALFTISILRALHMPAFLKFAGYAAGSTHPSHVYAYTLDSTGAPILIDGCYPYFNKEKKPTFTKISDMTVTSLSGITADSTQEQKKKSAQKFLNSLPPRQRKRVLQAYAERCRHYGVKKPRYRPVSDEYGVMGAPVIGDEYDVISAQVIAGKKKKKKLTKTEKVARRKKRNAKAKKGLKKFAWGVAFVNLLPIRAAFTAILACNFNGMAHNMKKVYEAREGATKAEWKKIEKVWYNIGGLKKALLKAMNLGSAHKPLFLSKKAKEKFKARNKGKIGYIGALSIDDIEGIGAAPVIAAALAAAAGVIAAIIPPIMQGLKKTGNNTAAAEVQAQGEQMVQDYKAQGSPQPLTAAQVGQGAPSAAEPNESGAEEEEEETVEGVGALGQEGLTTLFDTLGKVAQVGIQAAGVAVAKKAKKNPKINKVLNTAGTAAEDYFTGKYLRDAGYTGAAKKYKKVASSAGKYALYAGGAAVVALLGYLVIKKK